MSYQKCPICNGSGLDPTPGLYSDLPTCPTCKGQRIISELTGKPPQQEQTTKSQNVYQSILYDNRDKTT